MKKILFLLACVLFNGCITNAPDAKSSDYYWYENTKVSLEKGNQAYVIYDNALLSESDRDKLIEGGNVSYKEATNLKWGITEPNAVIEDLEHVLYLMSSYKSTDESNIFVTHRFYIKLKDSKDISLLQDMARRYNAEIEYKDEDSPLWYILQCGLPSSFNALELANIFYESGKFAAAEPEFIGGILLICHK